MNFKSSNNVNLNVKNVKAYNVSNNAVDSFKNLTKNSKYNLNNTGFDYKEVNYYEEVNYNEIPEETKSKEKKKETPKKEELTWYDEVGSMVSSFVTSAYDEILDFGEDYSKELGTRHEEAGVIVISALEGFLDVGEGSIDGSIYGIAKTLQIFGVDDQWAEDIISYDASGKMYDSAIEETGIDKDIAYGDVFSVGNFIGDMLGYFALSSIPYAGVAISCVGGAGKGVEDSINTQMAETGEINDWEVFGDSALGALEGYGYGKASQALGSGVKTVAKNGIKTTVKETVGSLSKDAIKTTIKTSGKEILKNTAVNTLKDKDTWVETSAVLATDIKQGIKTGEWDVGSMALKTATVYGENYVGNLLGGVAFESMNKVDMHNMPQASTLDRVKNKLYLENIENISDQKAYEVYKASIYDALAKAKQSGNKDIENMLEKLYLLEKERPNFAIKFDPKNSAFSDAYGTGSLNFGSDVILGNRKNVVYHELGHTLHGVANKSQVPSNYIQVKDSINNHMFKDPDYVASCMDYFQNSKKIAYSEATKYFDENLSNTVIQQLNNVDWDSVRNDFRNAGFSEQQIDQFILTDFEKQYYNIRNSEISRIAGDYQREWGVDAASDIIGSVFPGQKKFVIFENGTWKQLGGELTYHHPREYYTQITDKSGNVIYYNTLDEINESAFHEQIANYTSLKLSGNDTTIDMLHNLFGDDWYQMMESSFSNITNYFK